MSMLEDLKAACEILRQGGIILYPNDTIWGIGCDATCEEAVQKIYKMKQRQDEKSMLVLLDDAEKLKDYIAQVPDIAWNILAVADKPITIIYPGAQNLAKNLLADDGTIGIRITRDEFCKKLIARLGKPLVSTSANISGKPWPESFQKVEMKLVKGVDYVVKWRQNEEFRGKPSEIIKVGLRGEIKIIRE
jgi:L-threonylcarbamoyladenylate synthase